MKQWWDKKREKMRKGKKKNDNYTFLDFILDVLLWIPELVILPFRIIFWFVRGIGRLIGNIFDIL